MLLMLFAAVLAGAWVGDALASQFPFFLVVVLAMQFVAYRVGAFLQKQAYPPATLAGVTILASNTCAIYVGYVLNHIPDQKAVAVFGVFVWAVTLIVGLLGVQRATKK